MSSWLCPRCGRRWDDHAHNGWVANPVCGGFLYGLRLRLRQRRGER